MTSNCLFARGFAGIGLVVIVLSASAAGADPGKFEDSDELTEKTHRLDSVRHTEGDSLGSVDQGRTNTLEAADTGHTVTLDDTDSGSTTDLDTADTGHTVSLDAAEAGDDWEQ